MTEPQRIQLEAQLVWGDIESLPVLAASHFLVQVAVHDAPNVKDVILTMGYLAPPLLLGSLEQQIEAASAVTQLVVKPLARFSIPASKMAELAGILGPMLKAIEGGEALAP